MNQASLTGRLTADIELHHTKKSNTPVTTFALAVDRPYTNKDGKRLADFPIVTVWRKPANTLYKYGGQGSLIGISGRTQTRSYKNKDNKTVYVQEIVANSDGVELLNTKPRGKSGKTTSDLGNEVDDLGTDDDGLPF